MEDINKRLFWDKTHHKGISFFYAKENLVEVNLFQKHLFLQQLTHNMSIEKIVH